MRNGLKMLMALLLSILPAIANAVPVTFLMGGQLPTGAGEPWIAYLTIDDNPVESTESSAVYVADSPGYGMVLTVGGLVGVAHYVWIEIWNDHEAGIFGTLDSMRLRARGSVDGGLTSDWLGMDMWWVQQGHYGAMPDATDSTSLFPQPGGFPDPCFEINLCSLVVGDPFDGVGFFWMGDEIEDLWVTRLPFVIPVPVPEPSTLGLLGLALLCVRFAVRRS